MIEQTFTDEEALKRIISIMQIENDFESLELVEEWINHVGTNHALKRVIQLHTVFEQD